MMRKARSILLFGAAFGSSLPLHAQGGMLPMPGTVQPLKRAIIAITPADAPKLTIGTPGWADGGDIPFENTQYGENLFPGLKWSSGPRGTRSYAIVMQDVDSVRDGIRKHALHWTLFNIPPAVTSLPGAMTADAKPAGSSYGPNYKGQAQPYLGPRTPPGPRHHYHIQIFALDRRIAEQGISDYDRLLSRMKSHVLASGEVVGLGRAPDTP